VRAQILIVLLIVLCAAPATARSRPALIVLNNGFGTEKAARVWGRALYDTGRGPAQPDESKWRKVKRSLGELDSDEMRDVNLTVKVLGKSYAARADHEGMFRVDLAGPLPLGTHDVDARIEHKPGFRTEAGRLQIFPGKPGTAVISDIDDTVLQSNVANKGALIRKVLSSNAHDLQTFPQAPALYRIWAKRGYPIVFVSGSPQNLYSRLTHFFTLRGFPTASALLLKNLGLEKGADSLFETHKYKLRRIREVRELLPGYRLLLVGDSGEKDPETYAELRKQDAAAVLAVMIHRVTKEQAVSRRFAGQLVFDSFGELGRELHKRGLLSAPELKALQAVEGGKP
jgi:phosphatidate phosphatase APP1